MCILSVTQICRYIAKIQLNLHLLRPCGNRKKVPTFRWRLADVHKIYDTCLYIGASHRHRFVPCGLNPHTLYHNFGIPTARLLSQWVNESHVF